jgi:hypothetical protein
MPVAAGLLANIFVTNAAYVSSLFPQAILKASTEFLGQYPYQIVVLFAFAMEILLLVVRRDSSIRSLLLFPFLLTVYERYQ